MWPGHESDYTSPLAAKAKYEWSYNMHRDNFTSAFTVTLHLLKLLVQLKCVSVTI
jgi:hypothetical protein